jgi:ATP-dependent exoDNAse (exonuclease V) alpha subunit
VNLRLTQAEFKGSLLIVGDFLQLPPVERNNTEVMFAFESPAWLSMKFETLELTHIYRTDDKRFIELLHHIRFGVIDESIHNHLNEYIKPLPHEIADFTFLFGKNISADMHNKEQLKSIDEELFTKEAQIIKHDKNIHDGEVERFMNDARIEKNLYLKIGAPVLFTRNAWNYFNGERGIVVNKDASYIYVQKEDKKIVKLESVAMSKTLWREKIVDGKKEMLEESVFTIHQYPIKLAFAITIHKSQGMSIENLIIDTNEIFAPSQFYVALSRSSNPSRLILIAPRVQWYQLAFVDQKAVTFVKGE